MSSVVRFGLNTSAKPPLQEVGSHRLQIVMSEASAQQLTAFRDAIEASSFGEVVRRALRYYEKLLQSLDVPLLSWEDNSEDHPLLTTRLQIVLSQRTLERLERLQKIFPDTSLAEIIRTALTVFQKAYRALDEGKPSFEVRQIDGSKITVHSGELAA